MLIVGVPRIFTTESHYWSFVWLSSRRALISLYLVLGSVNGLLEFVDSFIWNLEITSARNMRIVLLVLSSFCHQKRNEKEKLFWRYLCRVLLCISDLFSIILQNDCTKTAPDSPNVNPFVSDSRIIDRKILTWHVTCHMQKNSDFHF